jgi:hypothetical protein
VIRVGTVRLQPVSIDDQGNLWIGQFINNDPGSADGFSREYLPNPVALDGSRIDVFRIPGPGGVKLRRLTNGDRVTWDVQGTLCTPRDIDAVRKMRRSAAPASPPPSVEVQS